MTTTACGSLERLLAHAIRTWVAQGAHPEIGRIEDYEDFARDGWRCTFPGCTARRWLESHHIWFRSDCGPDVAWNRTTLCAYHHHRGVHVGSLAIPGRAPDGLIYELGVGTFGSGDVKPPRYKVEIGVAPWLESILDRPNAGRSP